MNFTKRIILILVVLVSCVGCDKATKLIAVSVLPEAKVFSYFGDTVRLQLVYNRGAFLSLGSSLPEFWRQWFFMTWTGFLLLCALAYAFLWKPGRPLMVLAIALVFAGGVCNLFDRIAYGGLVVDFLNVGIGHVRTGIFNVADIAITVGALILFLAAMRRQNEVR